MNKLIAALAILLAFSGCTNSEQEEARERQARREAEMQRLEELERRAHPPGSTHEDPVVEQEPATPPEPQYEEVTTYYFTSLTEKNTVECANEPELTSCGVTFTGCSGGNDYYCQTNVKHFTKTKKVLVTPEE